jgi:hypothetical protein
MNTNVNLRELLRQRAIVWSRKQHIEELIKHELRRYNNSRQSILEWSDTDEEECTHPSIERVFWSPNARWLLLSRTLEAQLYTLFNGKWNLHRQPSLRASDIIFGVVNNGGIIIGRGAKVIAINDLEEDLAEIVNLDQYRFELDGRMERLFLFDGQHLIMLDLNVRDLIHYNHNRSILRVQSDCEGVIWVRDSQELCLVENGMVTFSIPLRMDEECLQIRRLSRDLYWLLLSRSTDLGQQLLCCRVFRDCQCVKYLEYSSPLKCITISGDSVFAFEPGVNRVVWLSAPDLSVRDSVRLREPAALSSPSSVTSFLTVLYTDRAPSFISLCE